MNDAELLLKWFVLSLAWLLALDALVFGVLLLLDVFRNPPTWWVRRQIPEPDDPRWTAPSRMKVER